MSGARTVAKRLTIVYFGVAISISLVLAAMAVPLQTIFGESYAGLAEVIWLLTPLPVLRAANNLLSEPLTVAASTASEWR